LTNAQDSLLVSFPAVVDGSVAVDTTSETYSAGAVLRRNWMAGSCGYLDFVAGYRYLRFREGLNIQEDLITTGPGFVEPDTTFDIRDTFVTETDFHGADIGIVTEFSRGRASLGILTKLGIGAAYQVVNIDGATTIDTPSGPPATTAGGLLAQPSNIGTQADTEFALLPELTVNLKYQLSDCLSFTLGYTMVYLTQAMRTGDQIDFSVNPSQLPENGGSLSGEPRPEPRFHSTDIWLQGLNIGGLIEF
jgi:hypothetical protein